MDKRRPAGSTYVVRDAPSDIVRGPSSRPPPADAAFPPPPLLPRLDAPIEEVVERVERFDFAPVRRSTIRPSSERKSGSTAAGEHTLAAMTRASEHPVLETAARYETDAHPSSVRPGAYASEGLAHFSERAASRRPSAPPEAGQIARVRTELDALDARSSTPPQPTPDPVRALLEELCRLPPEESARVLPRLVENPQGCLPELARVFPGPTWFDRRLPYRRVPRAAEASPITAAMAAIGEAAVPFVLPLLTSESADQRFFAAIVVLDLGVRRLEVGSTDANDLLAPMAQLLLDADAGVRGAARETVWALRGTSGYPAMLEGFRRCAADRGVQQVWRVRAIEALAELGDALALDTLIEQLVDDDRTIARAAHESLRRLTCHDLGSMRMAWRRWAKSQGRRHRFDWLVDALADRREDLRTMAFRELRRSSGESFGLTELSPRSACIEAQQKYLRWWQARR